MESEESKSDPCVLLASELPAQHPEVKFRLTHKANFPYAPSQKSKFLSFHDHVMYVSMCWAAAESDTQFVIFAYSALKKRLLPN